MNYKYIMFSLLAFAAIYSSCSSANALADPTEEQLVNFQGIDNPEPFISLSDHLRKVPGVNVRGQGQNARITIHGIHSFLGSSEPLFIVEGQQFSGGYRAVAHAVNVNDIKSIRVLKDPSDMAFYGIRGANGIIDIKLKN